MAFLHLLVLLVVEASTTFKAFSPSGWTLKGGYQVPLKTSEISRPTRETGYTLELWLFKLWSSKSDLILIEDAIGALVTQQGTSEHSAASSLLIEGELAAFSVEDGVWHHIAISRSGSSKACTAYIDAVGSYSYQGGDFDFSKLAIGDPKLELQTMFREVRLWGVPRSQTQLLNYLYRVADTSLPGLTMVYHLNEQQGVLIYDTENTAEVLLPTDKVWKKATELQFCSRGTFGSSCSACASNCRECLSYTECTLCAEGYLTLPRDYDSSGVVRCSNSFSGFGSPIKLATDISSSFASGEFTAEFWFIPSSANSSTLKTLISLCTIIAEMNTASYTVTSTGNTALNSAKLFYNQWYHFSLNLNQDAQFIYLNGKVHATLSLSTTVSPSCLTLGTVGAYAEVKLYDYTKLDGTADNDNFRISDLGKANLPTYYWPLIESKPPFMSQGLNGESTSENVAFVPLPKGPTICYGDQTAYKTNFGSEVICIDEAADKALSLATNPLSLKFPLPDCNTLASASSAIEFWYKADFSQMEQDSVLADFGTLKFVRGLNELQLTIESIAVRAGDLIDGEWKHYYFGFQRQGSIRVLDYTASPCVSQARLTSSQQDPCPSQITFNMQPGAFVRFFRWWGKEISLLSSVICSGTLPFTSFHGLSLEILLLDYPLNEGSGTVVVDRSKSGKITTVTETNWVAESTASFVQKRDLGKVRDSTGGVSYDTMTSGVLASSSVYFVCTVGNAQPTSSTSCESRSTRQYFRKLPHPESSLSHTAYVAVAPSGVAYTSFEYELSFYLVNLSTTACQLFTLDSIKVSIAVERNTPVLRYTGDNFTYATVPVKLLGWYILRVVMFQQVGESKLYLNGIEQTILKHIPSLSASEITFEVGMNCDALIGDIKGYNSQESLHERRVVFWDRSYASIVDYETDYSYAFIYDHYDPDTQAIVSSINSDDKIAFGDLLYLREALEYSPTVRENDRFSICAVNEYRVKGLGKYSCQGCSSNCAACLKTLCAVCISGTQLYPTSSSQSTCVASCPTTYTESSPVPYCKVSGCTPPCNSCYGTTAKGQCLTYASLLSVTDEVGNIQTGMFNLKKASSGTFDASVPYSIQFWHVNFDAADGSDDGGEDGILKIDGLTVKSTANTIKLYDGTSVILSCSANRFIKGIFFSLSATDEAFSGYLFDPLNDKITLCTKDTDYTPAASSTIELSGDITTIGNYIYSLRLLNIAQDPTTMSLRNLVAATALAVRSPSSWTTKQIPMDEGEGYHLFDSKA